MGNAIPVSPINSYAEIVRKRLGVCAKRMTPDLRYADREGFTRRLYSGSRFDLFARAQVVGRDILLDRVRLTGLHDGQMFPVTSQAR